MLRLIESVNPKVLLCPRRLSHLSTLCLAPSCQRAALSSLKFKKSAKQSQSTLDISSTLPTPSWQAQQQGFTAPPLQSRDATVPSHYFPATPAPAGRVLVPNSSPGGPDLSYREDQTIFHPESSDSVAGLVFNDSWRAPTTPLLADPLSAPSGFVSSGRNTNASSSRSWALEASSSSGSVSEQGRIDGEPPRKRVHRAESPSGSVENLQTPGSPEILRPGHRRRPNAAVTLVSVSSNDSLSDTAHDEAGPSRPRIIRGQRSEASSETPLVAVTSETSQSESEAKFIRFRTINQMFHSVEKIRAAWEQAGEDAAKATALLDDPNFHVAPKPVSVARPKPSKSSIETGRVRELEEATRAERARVREMGKKSAIYATPALPTVTPPASKVNGSGPRPSPLSPATPASPNIVRPTNRNLKRKVVASEDEYESSNDEGGSGSDGGPSGEDEALAYFNASSAEALQELTGRGGILCRYVLLTLGHRVYYRAGSQDC